MIDNPYYSRELHGTYELFDLGDFVLEEGYTLRDCKRIGRSGSSAPPRTTRSS
ncbi:MAG TPA: hypothetical protein VKA51_00665 [Rubrobacteraceae bacterium]|nr:hypothetical protein [Rubrobacteraceae bacterium]